MTEIGARIMPYPAPQEHPADSLPYTCFLLNGDMKLYRNWHFFI